ncbi:hypothetical protein [Chitinophaga pinensis]|uniref:Uncharacterized protein n=1 Tax=Chitinophaga pinensis (strain ATCC 43595 / DSM 2588 / LMG 13176 / NBRC 15968 / NCIMB 11800 / UQM 2034) TaxID=485918 RepID=A0A979G7S4_CHIPD|nr:hypothetical protein [Chitinophaga pinensis]ACU62336.1 hypothetical protein Cpin_4902 [Chitinophaga pinensis DSM 2588]
MKNNTSQQPLTWETPDMIVLPIDKVTLGKAGSGSDFAAEWEVST